MICPACQRRGHRTDMPAGDVTVSHGTATVARTFPHYILRHPLRKGVPENRAARRHGETREQLKARKARTGRA